MGDDAVQAIPWASMLLVLIRVYEVAEMGKRNLGVNRNVRLSG